MALQMMIAAQIKVNGENMSKIQDLTARIHDLERSVSRWNNIYVGLVAFTVFLAASLFISQFLAMRKSKELTGAQKELLRLKEDALQADLQEEDSNIAQANQRAGEAEERVRIAEQHTAEANAKAEGFRLDIAKANEGAAKANEVAERERLARLQLEARLAPRSLTPAQQGRLTSQLNRFRGTPIDVAIWGDTSEIQNISIRLTDSLRAAGWTVGVATAVGGGAAVTGILIGTSDGVALPIREASSSLVIGLHDVGLEAGPWPFAQLQPPGVSVNAGFTGQAPIRMFIGAKP